MAELASNSEEPWLVWCELNDESDALTKSIQDAVEIAGKHDNETKESRMMGFTRGEHRVVVTKPSLAGYGMNWQHCNNMAFVGLSHSYEQFYQAVRRCWRFGQKSEVTVDIVLTEGERKIMKNLQRKNAAAMRMFDNLVAEMNNSIHIQKTTEFTKREEIPQWL